jgi:predicted nucleic acid-binding protein
LNLYFDSAYIAKCYLNEVDGLHVRKLAESATGLYSSALCLAELACVFHRQLREGSLTAKQAGIVRREFAADIENEVWGLIPVTADLLRRVDRVVHTLPSSTFIRAGDAIHIASAIEYSFDEIWTNDRHLLAAAEAAGLRGKSVS